jgi:hypothetical protein
MLGGCSANGRPDMPGGYICRRTALQATGEDGVRSGGRADGGHVSARMGRCAPRHVCQPTPRHEGEGVSWVKCPRQERQSEE